MNKRKINTFPLKIAVLGHKTIPSRQGGIEIVVEELTVRMAKLGHKTFGIWYAGNSFAVLFFGGIDNIKKKINKLYYFDFRDSSCISMCNYYIK